MSMATQSQSAYLKTRVSLLARLKGEPSDAAWQEFYQLYWRAVYGYALRFGMPKAEVEDVVQEVFIKLCRRLPTFTYDRARGRFLSWIKTVTRTTVADFLRRRGARPEGRQGSPAMEVGAVRHDSVAAPDRDGDKVWQEEWEASLLALALERVRVRVSPQTVEAFRRFALEEQPAEAVATALRVSPNAVYLAKARIVRLLKAEVAAIRKTV